MASTTDRLISDSLIQPPSFLKNNVHYEVMMGSIAYNCHEDTSDIDIYGFCIPPKNVIFPHLNGYIDGFSDKSNRFDQFQKHHIIDKTRNKEYDLNIYNIVKYFKLCMDNNPNMIDSLFVPRRCILHSTQVGEYIRDNRHLFLHKGSYHKFRGYSFSQMQKCRNKTINEWVGLCNKYEWDYHISFEVVERICKSPEDLIYAKKLINKIETNGVRSKRIKLIAKYGFDTKFAYHIVRLLEESEQILAEGDLDLERSAEILKAIRRGEWTLDDIERYFSEKENYLRKLYNESKLQHSPNQDQIKDILLQCLEMHYGSLDACIINQNAAMRTLIKIRDQINQVVK